MIYNNPDDAWMKHASKEGQPKYGCFQVLAILIGFLIAMAICALCSCSTTKYVPVPEFHTDTLLLTRNIWDSIYVHDSTYVREAGDTILIERWHTQWRDRWRTDTIYQSKRDSIPYPVEVTKEVPADVVAADAAIYGQHHDSAVGNSGCRLCRQEIFSVNPKRHNVRMLEMDSKYSEHVYVRQTAQR